MSRPRFTEKGSRTFGKWFKEQPKDSEYAKKIDRRHQIYPNKSLKQLRELKKEDYDWSNRAWDSLSPQEKRDRLLSLEVLRDMRHGENLTNALKKRGLKKGLVLKHLGRSLYKKGGKWKVTALDSVQARMRIYSTEGQRVIVTTNRSDRVLISQYSNSVQKALKNKNPSVLDKFKDLEIIDANGKAHKFQTDLAALYEIKDAQEEPEHLELYVH